LSSRKKICWVKWAEICRTKKEGGLGIRDLRILNLSLLGKWRWKLLMEGDDMWKRVVVAKYGGGSVGNAGLDVENFSRGASVWCRDICRLDNGLGWFNNVAIKVIGNGGTIRFWKDVWVTNQSLQTTFPRLFSMSTQQDEFISDMGSWRDGVWRWNLLWQRNFFVWEEGLVQQLLQVISLQNITVADDRWVWGPAIDEGFSVKSLYVHLDSILSSYVQRSVEKYFAFRYIWKSGVPSKVSAMAWQLLINRIPTKDNLCHRGVISIDEAACPWCSQGIESSCHLFLHCHFSAAVWNALTRWLGVVILIPPNALMAYVTFVTHGSNNKRRKGYSIVWLAFVWSLWKFRNDRIFNNKVASVEEVVGSIQHLSWRWFLNNTAKSSCLLYEWVWNPGDCMLR
jgi:hypothetical protein